MDRTERIKELEKILESVCVDYEELSFDDCIKCPCKAECEEYLRIVV